jgi:hypothetical protein
MYGRRAFHTLGYPNIVDLTEFQQSPELPLSYQLSSVVSHTGDFSDAEDVDKEMARKAQAID